MSKLYLTAVLLAVTSTAASAQDVPTLTEADRQELCDVIVETLVANIDAKVGLLQASQHWFGQTTLSPPRWWEGNADATNAFEASAQLYRDVSDVIFDLERSRLDLLDRAHDECPDHILPPGTE